MGAGGADYKARKEQASAVRRLKSRVAAFEKRSEEIDAQIERLNAELCDEDVARDYVRNMEISDMLAKLHDEQGEVIAQWEKASEELMAAERTNIF